MQDMMKYEMTIAASLEVMANFKREIEPDRIALWPGKGGEKENKVGGSTMQGMRPST